MRRMRPVFPQDLAHMSKNIGEIDPGVRQWNIRGKCMYTIVEINNKQYKLEEGKPALIDRLDAEENSEIEINKVLLLAGKESGIKVGKPYIRGLTIKAKVLGNSRGKKVRVFKYKKRKDYRRTIGSRPVYTRILVEKVGS